MANPNEQPDLASVLRRLAEFASAAPTPTQTPPLPPPQVVPYLPQAPAVGGGYGTHVPSAYPQTASPAPRVSHAPTPDPRSIPTHRRPAAPSTPPIDPATITEWAPGLRCVSKIAEANPNFKTAIRKIIAEQEHHEKMWWKGREELMEKQSQRASGAKNVNDILKALGGSTASTAAAPHDPKKMQAELDTYDAKVYRAQVEMYRSMSTELKTLGVPFFGMKVEYLSKMREADLLDLQRKMLGYLEDMYKV